MMDGRGRLVSIFILCVWSTIFADPVIPPGLYETNFQALVSANMDTCDMKIKITDAKFYTPKELSPTTIASVPTNLSPSNVPGPAGLKGEAGSKGATASKEERGLKGDKGEPGSKGEKGLMGISGAKGDPGPMGEGGLRGEKGPKGDAGERGFEGKQGPEGVAGPPGEKGNIGDKGYKGESGSKGENGLKGEKGDVGPAGKDLTLDELKGPEEGPTHLGSSEKPATSCAQLSSKGVYTINPSNPFTINCTGEEMCLEKRDSEKDPEEKSINFLDKPFWLHPDFEDLYGIQGSQMAYLLSQSTGVKLTLKYHCYNTEVIPSKNPSNALLLYLWNAQLVGNSPTSESPISYEVYEDKCNMSTTGWESATIKMTTKFTHQLPVVDIFIKDIREGKQQAALELVELCFTYH